MTWTMYFGGDEVAEMTDEQHASAKALVTRAAESGAFAWITADGSAGSVELLWTPGVSVAFKHADA